MSFWINQCLLRLIALVLLWVLVNRNRFCAPLWFQTREVGKGKVLCIHLNLLSIRFRFLKGVSRWATVIQSRWWVLWCYHPWCRRHMFLNAANDFWKSKGKCKLCDLKMAVGSPVSAKKIILSPRHWRWLRTFLWWLAFSSPFSRSRRRHWQPLSVIKPI